MMNTQSLLVMDEVGEDDLAVGRAHVEAPPRAPGPSIQVSKVELPTGVADLERSEIRHANGQRCELSERETQLLRYLAANRGRPISRDEILQSVWRLDPRRLITRTIDMHVANLRHKLGDTANHPKVLLTVRGQGYMFAAPANG